jgi:uroporphyrinogen-III decarboxylase
LQQRQNLGDGLGSGCRVARRSAGADQKADVAEAMRARAKDFVEMCLTPTVAAELTLQPVRRYHMDGAILFSDILMLPYALGQKLSFREGEGPRCNSGRGRIGIGEQIIFP